MVRIRPITRVVATILFASLLLTGCASMQYPRGYKVEGKEYKEFKDLSDEEALKAIALIYNIKHDLWEDGIARSITLGEYLTLLKKRKSPLIKKSGIFDTQYEKVVLEEWSTEDLKKLYDALAPKSDTFYMNTAEKLSEIQNADRIIYLTAISAIVKEIKRRRHTESAVAIASQALAILSIALSVI